MTPWSSSLSGAGAAQETGYEPCHLLCSNEAGRLEGRSMPLWHDVGLLYLRVEPIWITPLGGYDSHRYRAIAGGASTQVVELLGAVVYRPLPWLGFRASMPWEYNHARGVALPTLHAVPRASSELAPAGIFASAHARLLETAATATWLGAGYRLTSAVGTTELEPSDVIDNPDKGIEGLGTGTDDVYVIAEHELHPLRRWLFAGSLEWHMHMLPRWERVYATTTGYRLTVRRELGSVFHAGVRLSGFYTSIPRLDIAQTNAVVIAPSLGVHAGDALDLSLGVSSPLPGVLLNRNALQTFDVFLALGVSVGRP